ncbi:TetR/AcrR family transcriptional regulator [Gandjariella thermophila]|uniref:TetR/AcrR family transcriptional regulator n=1 Tax=Gandjariella thermophila TaxID=1931992 RepID=UPI001CEF5DB5|nr:TetR/AcrR family transcriptional regulator [Gandjariella thermophila]
MPQRQAADESLLRATADAIVKWGVTGVTLERIAAEAGMSRATIYRRGVSCEQLVDALVTRMRQGFRDAVWPALTAPGTAADRLRAALDGLWQLAEEYLALMANMFTADDEELHREAADGLVVDVFAEPFERLLRDGAADGTLRDLSPTVTATALLSTAGWGYIHLRAHHGWSPERTRAAVLDLLLRGVLAEPAG